MKKVVISECPYCGSKSLVAGYQMDKGAMFTDIRGGVFGSQIEHIICSDCNSIIYSRVVKSDMFKSIEE